MREPYFLGIDAGTSNIKASFMDLDFHLIDEEKQNVSVFTPFPGASEIDMDDYWKRLCKVTQSLKTRNPDSWHKIAGVGITGQGDGLWPIDKDGVPVRNAMLWNDTRSKNILPASDALRDATVRESTNAVYAGSVAALLKWLKFYEPDCFGRVRQALHCKDWLNFKLTGRTLTDPTDASTSVFNVLKGKYSKEILNVLELPECYDRLPEVVSPTEVIGSVSGEVADLTGIREGTPVIEGAVDVCAAALGADVRSPGKACTIIGTTLGNEMPIEPKNIRPEEKRGLLMRHVVPGTYLWVLPTLSGASTMDFVKSMLFPEIPYPLLEEQMDSLPVGCGGLIYQPYIYGERAPFQNPFATGGFFGLTCGHTKLELMRSVFEGLAYSFYDCYRAFGQDFDILYLSGGASVSNMVCQMFCDVIGKETRRTETKETGALGVIRTVQVALGCAEDYSAFPEQKARVFHPDMRRHAQYMEGFKLFAELRNTMEPFWNHRERSLKFLKGCGQR